VRRESIFDVSLFVLLAVLACAAASYVYAHGYTLYYGDAEAHLNIARRVVDSRTPGPEQLGTVWLPLPHILMLPFVRNDHLWRTGLAGVIPSAASFVVAGLALFASVRRAFHSTLGAITSVLLFSANPNLLYLQSTPMTEALFLAALLVLLWATLWFRDTASGWAILVAGIAANAAALTRYEGWFVIPFVFVYLLLIARKKWHAILFGVLASLGPLAWLVHNQYYYSNALEFYNGPYSALAIYHRQIAAGMQPYPGDHDWLQAIHYFSTAARLVVGMPLLILGAAGFICAISRRVWWPMILFALVPAFYVWSMHSSGTPIFVPTLWPFSWYNTRYAIAVLPWAAFAAGAIVTSVPARARPVIAGVMVLVPLGFSIRTNPISICWKESAVNSGARREWTQETAKYLVQNFEPGSGIAISFGDLAGVLREAGIPIREALHEGNHPEWDATIARPDLMLSKAWVVANAGDDLDTAVRKAERPGVHYQLERQIMVKDAPAVEIYRRQP
jgi:hypothetical protein